MKLSIWKFIYSNHVFSNRWFHNIPNFEILISLEPEDHLAIWMPKISFEKCLILSEILIRLMYPYCRTVFGCRIQRFFKWETWPNDLRNSPEQNWNWKPSAKLLFLLLIPLAICNHYPELLFYTILLILLRYWNQLLLFCGYRRLSYVHLQCESSK